MSKKLLSEAQVRRFQSLASIKPLQEMGNYAMKRDEEEPMEEVMHEEEVEEGMYKRDEEERMEGVYKRDEEEKMEEKMEDDGDLDVDTDADGDDDVEIEEEMIEKASDALSALQALVDALGGEAGAMDMGEEEPEMDAEMPAMDDEEPAPLEEEELLELALEGIEYQPSQKEIVKEVAKRVARRLQEAKNAQANLDKALGKK